MKVFIAVEHNLHGERMRWSDDVNLVVFCAKSMNEWPAIAELFNAMKLPAMHYNLSIDIKDNWIIREIGETTLFTIPTIIEHAVADS